MGKLAFMHGIHPPGYKSLTYNKSIQRTKTPSRVVIPLSQHAGKPAKPIVRKGDHVLKGQKIGELQEKISATVHSSVSGKVSDICLWNHPVISEPVLSVIIDSDGLNRQIEITKTHSDYYRYSPDELRNLIKEAGIVGLGGAAFPTEVKLSPPPAKDIDTVILNGCECEPYLTNDDYLIREHAKETIEGLKIIMFILDVHRGIVAIEDNKPEAIEIVKKIVFDEPNIELKTVKTKYPQGAEKVLIKTVLDREVPSGGLPFDVGVIVQNVGTTYAVCQAVKNGLPLIDRIITVTGHSIERPGNYNVCIGTLAKDLLDECEYIPGNHKIIFGGPMMGIAQKDLNVPIIKGTSGILVLPADDENMSEYYSCVRCGRCIDSCPLNLMPGMISIYAERQLWEQCSAYYPFDCIECGCCAYECAAKRPLVQHIKLAKLNLKRHAT